MVVKEEHVNGREVLLCIGPMKAKAPRSSQLSLISFQWPLMLACRIRNVNGCPLHFGLCRKILNIGSSHLHSLAKP